ncbi:MAG: hypothetical protein ACREIA_08530 [Opitutaceae bacterium]
MPGAARAGVYDVNDLTVAADSGDVAQTVTNANGAGGNFIRYRANAASDFITFNVSVPTTQTMTVMIDRENEPVGMVPRDGFLIKTSVRQYKYGWHHTPTAVEGPVWVGYDEIRMGRTVRDGTGYSDVHPSQLPMP